MNRIKLFFGVACLVIAGGTALASKASTLITPEYYYVPTGTLAGCQLLPIPTTNCVPGTALDCKYDFSSTVPVETYQVYDVRNEAGICVTPLERP